MPSFYTLPTALGEAKIANAIALGTQVNISELAVGDGGGSLPTPDSDRTALVNELRRAPINRIEVDNENPNWIVVEQILPPDVGGWTVRELGLLDDDGNLIAYGNYPETYKPVLSEGSGRTQTIRFVMQVSDTAAVTLKVDPSVVLATREYVDSQREEHEASRGHPLATTSDRGMVEKATAAEAKAGAADKFPDAEGMRAAVDDEMAYQNVVVFDAAGTSSWTVPQSLQEGRRMAHVTVIGGGGSGGRRTTSAAGGGGGGGVSEGCLNLSGVASVVVTVGAGGTRITSGTASEGNSGQSSSFGTYLSATGGEGGKSSGAGGPGGVGQGGDLVYSLGGGGAAQSDTELNDKRGGIGGGSGGAQTFINGSDGASPGSGGGGSGSSQDKYSGSGADGIVIVRW